MEARAKKHAPYGIPPMIMDRLEAWEQHKNFLHFMIKKIREALGIVTFIKVIDSSKDGYPHTHIYGIMDRLYECPKHKKGYAPPEEVLHTIQDLWIYGKASATPSVNNEHCGYVLSKLENIEQSRTKQLANYFTRIVGMRQISTSRMPGITNLAVRTRYEQIRYVHEQKTKEEDATANDYYTLGLAQAE